MSKKQPEKPNEQDEYDLLNSSSDMRGPLFWALLLLVPIIVSVLVSLFSASNAPPEPQEAQKSSVVMEGVIEENKAPAPVRRRP